MVYHSTDLTLAYVLFNIVTAYVNTTQTARRLHKMTQSSPGNVLFYYG